MSIRVQTVVLEARDPHALARFYAELLGLSIILEDDGWVDIGASSTTHLRFQHAPEHQAPRWPDPAASMQMHLDIEVDDIDRAEATALALGASRLSWDSEQEVAQGAGGEDEGGFRVYADPAGHPFCLGWE